MSDLRRLSCGESFIILLKCADGIVEVAADGESSVITRVVEPSEVEGSPVTSVSPMKSSQLEEVIPLVGISPFLLVTEIAVRKALKTGRKVVTASSILYLCARLETYSYLGIPLSLATREIEADFCRWESVEGVFINAEGTRDLSFDSCSIFVPSGRTGARGQGGSGGTPSSPTPSTLSL